MARMRRDLTVEVTKEEMEGFEIPEGWRPYWDQWLTRARTVELLRSKDYGCTGCGKAGDCEIRKAVCAAMGENYPIFPKDWLTIMPEGYDAYSEQPRVLCKIRVAQDRG